MRNSPTLSTCIPPYSKFLSPLFSAIRVWYSVKPLFLGGVSIYLIRHTYHICTLFFSVIPYFAYILNYEYLRNSQVAIYLSYQIVQLLFSKIIHLSFHFYDMTYLTASRLTPGGGSTVHIYTQTIHGTTQSTQTVHRTTQFTN